MRYLVNIKTSEVIEVGADEDQRFYSLCRERDEDNRPVYQQTGAHDPRVKSVIVPGQTPASDDREEAPEPTLADIAELTDAEYPPELLGDGKSKAAKAS